MPRRCIFCNFFIDSFVQEMREAVELPLSHFDLYKQEQKKNRNDSAQKK